MTFINCNSQSKKSIGIGVAVKQDQSNLTKDITAFLEAYFSTEDYSKEQNAFISQRDKERFVYPLHLVTQAQNSSLYGDSHYYKPTILSVIDEDSCQVVNVSFAHCEEGRYSNLVKVLRLVIREEEKEKKISNGIFYNLSRYQWNFTKTEKINIYSDPALKVNYPAIDSLTNFSRLIASKLNTQPITFSYFVAKNFEEIQRIRGVIYENRFYDKAVSEPFNKLFYVGNGTFFYPHELVHLYTYHTFDNGNFHNFFDEGLATFWGGNSDKPLDYHLRKVKGYVTQHQDILLGDINAIQYVTIDNETNTYYAIAGLICKMVYENKGFDGLKTLFTAGKSDDDVYKGIEQVLRVKKQDLDAFIRKELEKY